MPHSDTSKHDTQSCSSPGLKWLMLTRTAKGISF